MDINELTYQIRGSVFDCGLGTDTHGRTQTGNISPGAKTQNGKNYKARVVGGEVAKDLFDRGLCLPSGTAMTNGDLDRIIKTILKCQK